MKEKTNRQYTYDAFISYRHAEPDKFVAENLHRYLEAFKPPKSILKSGKASRARIERVFRDKDELPLTSNLEDPLVNALKQSEYLIVICSPRLKESVWCRKEIETFIAYHGRENIFAVLVEGEPEEAFPEELLYVDEYFYYSDGTQGVNRRVLEPLAADVRAQGGKKEMLKALKSEMLRLLAPMFGVTYDDLRQRHRERKLKKIAAISLAAAVLCLVIGAFSTAAALHIKKQKEQIEAQADEIVQQADEISAQNQRLLEEQAKSLAEKSLLLLEEGDREGAVLTARQALSEYEEIEMPYTPEAKYALTESMHVYDSGNVTKAKYQITASGIIDCLLVSPDGKIALTHDNVGTLMIWDAESGKLIDTREDAGNLFTENHAVFIDMDRFAYITDDGAVNIYNIPEKKLAGTIEGVSPMAVFSDSQGGYFAIRTWHNYVIYDAHTLQQHYTCAPQEGYQVDAACYFSDSDVMIYAETQQEDYVPATPADAGESDTAGAAMLLHFVDVNSKAQYAFLPIAYDIVSDVRFKGQNVYILANSYSSETSGQTTAVICCNAATGEQLWEKSFDRFATDLCVSYAEGADTLLLYSALEMFLIDETTGAELGRFSSGAEIVRAVSYKNMTRFMLFTRSGKQGVVMPDVNECLWVDYAFECKSQNVDVFEPCAGGFLVLPYNDNRVTVYGVSTGPDLQPCEDAVLPEPERDEIEDYVAEAEKLGLERAVLVEHMLYSPDDTVVFVSYADSTMEIYQVSDMRLLADISGMKCEIEQYLGTDNQGNIYIAGQGFGYCLDSDYNLTAKIENLLAVDRDGNRLLVGTQENLYQLPIYTTEELLHMDLEELF